MRILYGVVGEGMGHATRSKVTLEWLLGQGHQVKVVVSGRAHKFLDRELSSKFPRCDAAPDGTAAVDVIEILGLIMKYVDNAFDDAGSVLKNVLRVPAMVAQNASAYYDDIVRFRPQAVITDFDSFAHLYGRVHGIPIVSIDNQAIIHRCEIPEAAKDADRSAFVATKAFVKAKMPGCEWYIVTSFFFPPLREKYAENTVLVPPILRKAILDARPTKATEGKHFVVYQTSASDTTLVPTLQAWGEPCVVYGLNRDEKIGNLVLKPFSEQGFVDDLAMARGVVANGGLSLLNEAVSLHKPVFSVPVRNQYEQILNAFYLAELGYGMWSERIDSDGLRAFSGGLPGFAEKVSAFQHDANAKLFGTLGRVLEDLELRAFKREVRE
jgi:uncharacterized protein (TIGR00661 family)